MKRTFSITDETIGSYANETNEALNLCARKYIKL